LQEEGGEEEEEEEEEGFLKICGLFLL